MKIDKYYEFDVSLSKDAYRNKEIAAAMIGSSFSPQNREVRSRYGFNPNQGVGYKKETVTAEQLCDRLCNGNVLCHLFEPSKYRRDGYFASTEKCNRNFVGSYVVCVDIDDTGYQSISEYITKLEMPPTFYYSSYSHKRKGESIRFRMMFVFDEKIEGWLYFRYCAWSINKKIETDTKEEIHDRCNLNCAQYFNGTCKGEKDIVFESGVSNIIYSLDDFGIGKEGYKLFLQDNAHYKGYTHAEEIKAILNGM